MNQNIVNITFLVNNYDEAIEYFTNHLSFTLIEDTIISEEKRWVRIAPDRSVNFSLLLAKATTKLQKETVGCQFGDRVGFFIHTDNFAESYEKMKNSGVKFIENPRYESYGTVVVFEDLYGNKWDLIESV